MSTPKPKLYPFQQQGVDFLSVRASALLADEQGLGKTAQAICALNKIGALKVLIVCPALVKLNWKRELEMWLENKSSIQILNGRQDKIDPKADILIVNYDLLISMELFKQIISRNYAAGIFDEAHYMKNRKAKRTKAVLLQGAIASRCVFKWFLTGTPILNRPVELFPILKSVASCVIEPYDTYTSFALRFCGAYWDGVQFNDKGASNTDDLAERLGRGFMLRRLKKDVLTELPSKTYQMISIPATGKMNTLIQKEFTFSKGDAKYHTVGGDGAELALIRHELALSKVKTCLEHIEDVLTSAKKVVVFAYHKDVIKALAEGLKHYCPVTITGDTPQKLRQSNIENFQSDDESRVFIGQIQAAGIGITLTAASHVIFVESSWVPGEIDQATDRCHRIGQKDSVLVQFLVIEKSLEENMIRAIIDKKRVIESIVDPPSYEYMFT